MVKNKILLIAAATLMMTGCKKLDIAGMFLHKGTDVRIRVQQSLEYNEEHGYPSVTVPNDDYRFYVCADIHAEGYPKRFAEMVRRENADTMSYFYLVLGDLIWTQEHMSHFPEIMPIEPGTHVGEDTGFMIVGNHDLFYDNWDGWRAMFHTSTYYIEVHTPHYNDLFIMLDSGSGSLGDNQTDWLKRILKDKRPNYRHCIVCLHNNLFRTDHSQLPSSNLPLEETYALMRLFADNNVDLVLQGHDHYRSIMDFEDVQYIDLDDLKDDSPQASYLTVDVSSTIGYDFIRMNENK